MDINKDLHTLRVSIDKNIKEAKIFYDKYATLYTAMDYQFCFEELAIVRAKLIEAKMWAGKCLEKVGSPYPEELKDEYKENR